jgi:hypothetical protein
MAVAAFHDEVRFTFRGVTDQYIHSFPAEFRRHSLPSDGGDNTPYIRCYSVTVFNTQANSGHALALPAALNDGHDQLSVFVAECNLRAKQVRPAQITSAKIGAMAPPAVDFEQRLSARHFRRVLRWPFLTGDEAAGTLPCGWASGGRCGRGGLSRQTFHAGCGEYQQRHTS